MSDRDFVEGAAGGGGHDGGRSSRSTVGRSSGLGVGGLLGGGGFGQGGVDGGQAFVGSHILRVDREDRLELLLGDLEIAFIAGLQGFGEEQRLARGGVPILRDEGAGGESEGESGPSELRTVDIFHEWGALKIT